MNNIPRVPKWALIGLIVATLIAIGVTAVYTLRDQGSSNDAKISAAISTGFSLLLALLAVLPPLIAELRPQKALTNDQYENAISTLAQAETLLKEKDYNRAVDAATHVIQALPKNAAAYRVRGQAYFALGKLPSALTDLEMAIKYEPGYPFIYGIWAQTLSKMGEHERALDAWKKSLAFTPELAGNYFQVAHVLMLLGRYEEAEQWFKQVLAHSHTSENEKKMAQGELLRIENLRKYGVIASNREGNMSLESS